MARETSQWEREEMEKVVSETEKSSLFGGRQKVKMDEVRQEKSVLSLLKTKKVVADGAS